MSEFEKIVLELVGKVSVLETRVSVLQERIKEMENNSARDDYAENLVQEGRDKSRYSLDGEVFLKNRFVWVVVKKYIGEHPEVTYDDLKSVFKDGLQGSFGVVRKVEEIDIKNRVRYFGFEKKVPFNKNEDILVLDNGDEIAVCNQWGKENIQNIVKLANSLGYQVSKILGIKKEIIASERKPKNILLSGSDKIAGCMPLAGSSILTLHDSDCATFSYDDKIIVTIKESNSFKKLIHDMYQARDESAPIRVFKGDNDLGEWEVEEWSEHIDQSGAKTHFFQLIPFLHISLTQHPNTIYTSWPIVSKHVVSYQIEDKNIRLDYEENREKCGSVDALIPVSIYKILKSLFRSYYNLLNTNSGSGYSEEQAVMKKVPFGGVSITSYSYHICNKQATYVFPLFIGESNAATSLNKIINDIENNI